MPISPCCKRKYSKPKCICPSSDDEPKCTCPPYTYENIDHRGPCPPQTTTTEESDAASIQLYTPVIAAKPVSKKCCCCCGDVKPKKSFWQQLFGEKICCAPSQKKKQDCCKPKKKRVSNCDCCTDSRQSSLPTASKPCKPVCCCGDGRLSSFPPPSKPCEPVCCCSDGRRSSLPTASKPCKPVCCSKKAKPYREKSSCKPCRPTPESIFGCHFYCNVENRENQKRQSRRQCCCCCCCSSDTTDVTTEDEKPPPPPPVPKKESVVTRDIFPARTKTPPPPKPPPREPPIVKPAPSVHIGLTLTNTETKYYRNGSVPSDEERKKSKNNDPDGSGSSEQIITLEIHRSDSKTDREKNETRDNHVRREDADRRRRLSVLREEDEKHRPTSGSSAEEVVEVEVSPRSEEKYGQKDNMQESSSETLTRSREKKRNNSLLVKDNGIDKRVSEILRRLRTIENKINKIDSKKAEDTFSNPETHSTENGKKRSSHSFVVCKQYDSFEKDNYKTRNNGNSSRRPAAVIEIRKTRSKSYSPARRDSSSQISRYRFSRSLDRGSKANREKPKLVIKLPRGSREPFVSMSGCKEVKKLDYRDSEWMEVSNELKNRQEKSPCYCYECVIKRVSCRK